MLQDLQPLISSKDFALLVRPRIQNYPYA